YVVPKLTVIFPEYFYKLSDSVSFEETNQLFSAVLQYAETLDVNFKIGLQTSSRSRISFLIDDFTEKYLLLKLNKRNIENIIKNSNTVNEKLVNFAPNVVICFLVVPGGYLRSHTNDNVSSQSHFVSVWTFGCSVQYAVRPPNLKSYQNA